MGSDNFASLTVSALSCVPTIHTSWPCRAGAVVADARAAGAAVAGEGSLRAARARRRPGTWMSGRRKSSCARRRTAPARAASRARREAYTASLEEEVGTLC